MLKIVYTPSFVRQYDKLPSSLQEEVREKIALFRKNPNTPSLHAHKLKGKLKDYCGFRVNYKDRIVFVYDDAETVALLQVGDHDVYR